MSERPAWQDPTNYLKTVRSFRQTYEKEPIIQASVQLIMSVFGVAFFIFLAIRPTLATITTLLKKIDDQKVVDQKLDAKIAQLNTAQEVIGEFGDEIERLLGKAVPARPTVDVLNKQIEVVAEEAGVSLNSISVDNFPLVGNKGTLTETTKTPKGERLIGVTINGGGSSDQIEKFIQTLENMERVIYIDSAVVSRPEGQLVGKEPLTFSLKGKVFYLEEQIASNNET